MATDTGQQIMHIGRLDKEKDVLTQSVNYNYNIVSVAAISQSNKYVIKSINLNDQTPLGDIELSIPSTRDKKLHNCPIQWGTHSETEEVLAVGANQKLELWHFDTSGPIRCYAYFQGHLLAINDISWSKDHNIIGSCSQDSSVLIWDTRDSKKPAARIKSIYGASHISFNREEDDLLALINDEIVAIWDMRNVSRALAFLDLPKEVQSIDWHPTKNAMLCTASKDGCIRVWNYETSPEKEVASKSLKPGGVSRVKFTPCGTGLTSCSAISTLKAPSLSLWELRYIGINKLSIEVGGFIGISTEQVVDMEWTREENTYQLCVLLKNKEIKLIEVHSQKVSTSEKISSKVIGQRQNSGDLNRKSTSDDFDRYDPQSLGEEIEQIRNYISNLEGVEFEELSERSLSVKMLSVNKENKMDCKIYLPPLYPRASEPNFEIYTSSGTIDVSVKSELIQKLTSTAAYYVSHNQYCLKHCLDTLLPSFHILTKEENRDYLMQDNELLSFRSIGPFHKRISPALIGAKFGSNDILILFGMVRPLSKSPKTYAELQHRLHQENRYSVLSLSHSMDLTGEEIKLKGSQDIQSSVRAIDLSYLSYFNYDLAKETQFCDNNALEACHANRLMSASHGRQDLVQVWNILLYLIWCEEQGHTHYINFMGKQLIQTALEHYIILKDTQTLAVITCFLTMYDSIAVSANNNNRQKLELLEENSQKLFDHYKSIYAEILSRWELLNSKCKVLKCMSQDEWSPMSNRSIPLPITKQHNLKCSVCHIRSWSLVTFCPECGHGGHMQHILDWFRDNKECPEGCSCLCLTVLVEGEVGNYL